jgi:acetoin utilization protein AcuB
MYVADWMAKKVFSVTASTNIADAIRIMQEKKVKHLPVVDASNKVVGILSDRDIKEYTPSKVSSFDVHELNYILFTTKVKAIMKKKVFTTAAGAPIEEAAMIMYDNDIGCLPVVEKGRLIGIISDRDLFRVLVDITGIRHGGHRFYLTLEDKLGATKEVLDIVRDHGLIIESVLTTYEGTKKGEKKVVVRTKGKEGDAAGAKKEFEGKFGAYFSPY